MTVTDDQTRVTQGPAEEPEAAGAVPPARPGRRGTGAGRALGRTGLGLVVPLLLLLAWQVAASSGSFAVSQLPPPGRVLSAAGELARTGELWADVAISTQRVLQGFAAGAALAVLLGALVGLWAPARLLLTPTVQALRAVPSLAWVPLLGLWLGIYEAPKVTLVAIGAFFPVWTNVVSGLTHVDRHLVEVGRAYGLRGPSLVARVLLPAAAPSVFAGLRLGLAQAWLFLVAAELIASSKGLGYLLTASQNVGRTDRVVLAIVLLAVLGKVTDVVLGLLERRVLRWAR